MNPQKIKVKKPPVIKLPRSSFSRELLKKIAMFETFQLSMTSKTCNIEDERTRSFFADDGFSVRVFPIFKKMVKEIEESGLVAPKSEPSNVSYYQFKNDLPDFLPIAYGYDINSAYLSALFNVGYISEEMRDIVAQLPKTDRLAVIGMLATSKTFYSFEKGEVVDTWVQENKELRNVFFHVSSIVGLCLSDMFERESSLFFWVDGIICDKPAKTDLFKKHGFDFKEEKITDFKARVIHSGKVLKINYKKDGDGKTFEISKTIFLSKFKNPLKNDR
jgi:hypothetical protein